MCLNGDHAAGGCGCPAGRTERFLQPSLLLALQLRPSYGYELIEKIGQFGFVDGGIDPGIIYRHLRRLETEGFVSSRWDTSGSGPARRYYHLTKEGQELLRNWVAYMEKSKDALRRFLKLYRQTSLAGKKVQTDKKPAKEASHVLPRQKSLYVSGKTQGDSRKV